MMLGSVLNLSLRTLRHYDDVGLVTASGRTEGGFRLYTHEDYDRLILIRRMKPLGFSLEEMAELLRVIDAVEESPDADTRAILDGFVKDAGERRAKLQQQLAMADEFVALLEARR